MRQTSIRTLGSAAALLALTAPTLGSALAAPIFGPVLTAPAAPTFGSALAAPAAATLGLTLTAAAAPTFGLAFAAPAAPSLSFSVVQRSGLALGGVTWTGTRFIYTVEGQRTLYTADSALHAVTPFAVVPANNGEMRCVLSPGAHGFASGDLYCHAAQGPIYRISADGRSISQFALIPGPEHSDGALAFDTAGDFGYDLLAVTGGSDVGSGGTVYGVNAAGQVRRVGSYSGPGGAENALQAPTWFGTVAGQLLLAIDKHDHLGRLLAMDGHGRVSTLVKGLTYGLNPLAAIPQQWHTPMQQPAPGLYLADWLSKNLLFAPAATLRRYVGSLFVGTERHGYLYLVRPRGRGYQLLPLHTNLHAPDYNFEGVAIVGG